ncbi:MAG TPA: GTP-binding protein, partial [Planctomycetes bacterium]|nr:GTP-binding protein [Planctomycetota bacterium]
MAKVSPENITNVALAGHADSGKTLLADAILLHAGIIKSLGSIEAGTTQSDTTPEEKEARRSIYNNTFSVEANGRLLNFIDTPGYFDFVARPIMAFSAVETAVLVVNGKTGVEVGVRKLWEYADRAGTAKMVVINRLDEEDADFERTVNQLKAVFGTQVTPVAVPNGKGAQFTGVVDILAADVPADFRNLRETLVENIVSADDALLEKYLETGEVEPAALETALHKAVASGALVPVVPASALKGVGIAEMLELMRRCLPSAAAPCRKVLSGETAETVAVDDKLRACVFKVSVNEFVGRISSFRIYSSTIRAGDTVYLSGGGSERIPKLYRMQGDK